MPGIVLEARGIVKRYGHVIALTGADLELRAGEVLAVVGLFNQMNLLADAYQVEPDIRPRVE